MALKDREKWDGKYAATECLAGREPCAWLTDNRDLLPAGGRALDLAMGEGRNALYLASLGFDVLGVDISPVAVARAENLAHAEGLTLDTRVADLEHDPVPEDAFDLILCFYYLDRNLFPRMVRALRPGGLLLFETFTVEYLKYSGFRREWVLEPNELVREFLDLHILRYREMDDPAAQKACASLAAKRWTTKELS